MSSPAPSDRAVLKKAIDEQRDAVLRLLDNRFADLATRAERELQAALGQARREAAGHFNALVRRLDGAANQEQWAAAVLDSAAPFAASVALFAVSDRGLTPLGPRRGEFPSEVALEDASGIRSAVESREPVITLIAASELSAPLAARFEAAGRAVVVPVLARAAAVAALVAAGEPFDVNGLEALGTLAGAAFERLTRPVANTPPAGIPVAHLAAQRFARVRVAEMRLFKSGAVRAGRAARNLYAELKEDVDSARDVYQRDHLSKSDAMPDYLHQELVRTLANDDAELLGENYPGPLA
jgi:hypothetical protein